MDVWLKARLNGWSTASFDQGTIDLVPSFSWPVTVGTVRT